jgi:hypothetical protein
MYEKRKAAALDLEKCELMFFYSTRDLTQT